MDLSSRSKTSWMFQTAWERTRARGELVPDFLAEDITKFAEFAPFLIVARLDHESRTMPIVFAGSDVWHFTGLEMTGLDVLSLSEDFDRDRAWNRRSLYFDHPCGRFEVLDVSFTKGKDARAALTILPVKLSGGQQGLLTFVEPHWSYPIGSDHVKVEGISGLLSASHIDIGAGQPDVPAM